VYSDYCDIVSFAPLFLDMRISTTRRGPCRDYLILDCSCLTLLACSPWLTYPACLSVLNSILPLITHFSTFTGALSFQPTFLPSLICPVPPVLSCTPSPTSKPPNLPTSRSALRYHPHLASPMPPPNEARTHGPRHHHIPGTTLKQLTRE
jgi:hypothetical protein